MFIVFVYIYIYKDTCVCVLYIIYYIRMQCVGCNMIQHTYRTWLKMLTLRPRHNRCDVLAPHRPRKPEERLLSLASVAQSIAEHRRALCHGWTQRCSKIKTYREPWRSPCRLIWKTTLATSLGAGPASHSGTAFGNFRISGS